jgi:hypothetical protein
LTASWAFFSTGDLPQVTPQQWASRVTTAYVHFNVALVMEAAALAAGLILGGWALYRNWHGRS